MVMRPRYAVFQARQSDVTAVALSTQALSFAMLSHADSIATFWRETTFGHVDLTGSVVLPDTSFRSAAMTNPTTSELIWAGVDAIRTGQREDPLAGYDGVLIVINPGRFVFPHPDFDASVPESPANPRTIERVFRAACSFVLDGNRPAMIVPAESVDFTTLHHEVGHALGLRHPIGLESTADDDKATPEREISVEYGSPYDVMGVPAQLDPRNTTPWWAYDSSRVGTAIAGWSGAVATRVGPNLSRAHLHWQWPEALQGGGRVVERPLPAPGADVRALLVPGRVLVMRTPGDATDAAGRTYVEYRDATGFDGGLAPAGDSSGAGVVVHQLRHTAGRLRLAYAGAVLQHAHDADVVVNLAGMTVTVSQWGEDSAQLTVSVGDNAPRVELVVTDETGGLGGATDLPTLEETPCGTTYRTGTWLSKYGATYIARSYGTGASGEFSGPAAALTWSLDGSRLPSSRSSMIVSGEGDVESRRVECTVDPQGRLEVSCGYGVRVDVEVAAEVVGSPDARGVARLRTEGTFTGIYPDDLRIIGRCLTDSVPINVDWMEFPTGPPQPLEFGTFDPRLLRERQAWVETRLEMLEQVTGITEDQHALIRDVITEQLPG